MLLIAVDKDGMSYLITLNETSPYQALKLCLQSVVHLLEWADRQPRPGTIVQLPIDPHGGPKE